ncbi:hypothetical protein HDU98_006700 [Podochytrium sp. JEL0797]|nr:hypothetical protein HDU98_006700 [Podochytrium sp. JEL0797]
MKTAPNIDTFKPSTTHFDKPGHFYALNALDMQVLVNVVAAQDGTGATTYVIDQVTYVCGSMHETFGVHDLAAQKTLTCKAGSCATAGGWGCRLVAKLHDIPVPNIAINELYYGGNQAHGGLCFAEGMGCPADVLPPSPSAAPTSVVELTSSIPPTLSTEAAPSSTTALSTTAIALSTTAPLPPSTSLSGTSSSSFPAVLTSSNAPIISFHTVATSISAVLPASTSITTAVEQYCRVNTGYPCQILADQWIHTFKPSTIYFIETGLFYALNSEEMQVLINVVKDKDHAGLTVYIVTEVIYICDPHHLGSAAYAKESITVESLTGVNEKEFICEVGTCKRGGGTGCYMTVVLHKDPIPNVSMTNLYYGGSKAMGGVCYDTGMDCPPETLPPSPSPTVPTATPTASPKPQFCDLTPGFPCQMKIAPYIDTFKPSTIEFTKAGLFYALDALDMQVTVNVVPAKESDGSTVYVIDQVTYVCDPQNPGSADYVHESFNVHDVTSAKKMICKAGSCKNAPGWGCRFGVVLHENPVPNVAVEELYYGGSQASGGLCFAEGMGCPAQVSPSTSSATAGPSSSTHASIAPSAIASSFSTVATTAVIPEPSTAPQPPSSTVGSSTTAKPSAVSSSDHTSLSLPVTTTIVQTTLVSSTTASVSTALVSTAPITTPDLFSTTTLVPTIPVSAPSSLPVSTSIRPSSAPVTAPSSSSLILTIPASTSARVSSTTTHVMTIPATTSALVPSTTLVPPAHFCNTPPGFPCQMKTAPWIETFKPSTTQFEKPGLYYAVDAMDMQVIVNVVAAKDNSLDTVFVVDEVTFVCDPHNPDSSHFVRETIGVKDLASAKRLQCKAGSCGTAPGWGCRLVAVLGEIPVPSVSLTEIYYDGSKDATTNPHDECNLHNDFHHRFNLFRDDFSFLFGLLDCSQHRPFNFADVQFFFTHDRVIKL